MNTWERVSKQEDGEPCIPYQTLRGRHWTIYLIPRPTHCIRGNWLAQLHPNTDDPPRHDVEYSYVSSQDPWPRYYFDEARAKAECEAWLTKRKQRV